MNKSIMGSFCLHSSHGSRGDNRLGSLGANGSWEKPSGRPVVTQFRDLGVGIHGVWDMTKMRLSRDHRVHVQGRSDY